MADKSVFGVSLCSCSFIYEDDLRTLQRIDGSRMMIIGKSMLCFMRECRNKEGGNQQAGKGSSSYHLMRCDRNCMRVNGSVTLF